MEKVYGLIKIECPKKQGNYLEFTLKEPLKINSLGLYSYQNKKLFELTSDAYEIENDKVKLYPLNFRNFKSGEFLLGAITEKGTGYFEFSERQSKHLWECYYDFGIPEYSSMNLYGFLNLGGKLAFTFASKLEIDTNKLRIPYIGKVMNVKATKKSFDFQLSVEYDTNRVQVSKNNLKPVLALVDNEQQSVINLQNFEIAGDDGTYTISGIIDLPDNPILGNYCFAVETVIDGNVYLLDMFQISEELFHDIHPYTNDKVVVQGYDCEVFWFDREGVIFRIHAKTQKSGFGLFFGKYSFEKKLDTDEEAKWTQTYADFTKEWIKRSSLRKFG